MLKDKIGTVTDMFLSYVKSLFEIHFYLHIFINPFNSRYIKTLYYHYNKNYI